MGKTAIDAPRGNLFYVEPEKLVLITDKTHKLYDPRVELPVDEGLKLSMLNGGTFDPLMVFKDGERLIVLDGRQRVKAAMAANKELAEKGLPQLRLETIVKKGEERVLFAIQSAANENRRATSDLERARIIQRLMAFGYTEVEAGGVLGFNPAKTHRLRSLLDLDTKVQDALQAGKISGTAAAQLVKLEREKQVEELEKLLVESGGKKVKVRSAMKAKKRARGEKVSDAPSRKEVIKFYEYLSADGPVKDKRVCILSVLDWVLTGTESADMGAVLAGFRKDAANG